MWHHESCSPAHQVYETSLTDVVESHVQLALHTQEVISGHGLFCAISSQTWAANLCRRTSMHAQTVHRTLDTWADDIPWEGDVLHDTSDLGETFVWL